jgi:hypothetical protein
MQWRLLPIIKPALEGCCSSLSAPLPERRLMDAVDLGEKRIG